MGVVAPVSGVGAAVVPVAGRRAGRRAARRRWSGSACVVALPGIWLVAREPSPRGPAARRAAGCSTGCWPGSGFGVLFAALAQVPEDAGLLPAGAEPGGRGASRSSLVAAALRSAWRTPRAARPLAGLVSGAAGRRWPTGRFLLATQGGPSP